MQCLCPCCLTLSLTFFFPTPVYVCVCVWRRVVFVRACFFLFLTSLYSFSVLFLWDTLISHLFVPLLSFLDGFFFLLSSLIPMYLFPSLCIVIAAAAILSNVSPSLFHTIFLRSLLPCIWCRGYCGKCLCILGMINFGKVK